MAKDVQGGVVVEKTFTRQYGSTPWHLLTSFSNHVDGLISQTYAMEVGGGVLLRSVELRGHGQVAVALHFVKNHVIEVDPMDSALVILKPEL